MMLHSFLRMIYKDYPRAAYVVLRLDAETLPDDVAAELDVFDLFGERLICWEWALGVPDPDLVFNAWVKVRHERVLCAAVWVDDGVKHAHQPVPTGVVIGGWRHHNCLSSVAALAGEHEQFKCKQGFQTATGRYVDRKEAKRIAVAASQVPPGRDLLSNDELDSGDLY